MMDIAEMFQKLGVVPVVVLEDTKDAVPLAKALVEGGLPCAEVTFRTEGTEISCFLPAPQCTSEISVKADCHTILFCCFQAGQDQFAAAFSKCKSDTAQMKPGVTFQKFFHICFAEIIFGKGTVLSVIHHFTWADSVTRLQIIGSKPMCRCLFFC